MSTFSFRRLITCAPLLIALTPSVAAADADDAQKEATARALFEQASKLMNQKKYVEACPKLEDAVKLGPNGIGARMALGECFEGAGKLASAWATYSKAEALARAVNDSDRTKKAYDKVTSLKPQLATLTIAVPPSVASLGGFALKRDGIDVTDAQWGVPLPVDKGDHIIVAAATERVTSTQTVTIGADGAVKTVTIGELAGAPSGSSNQRILGAVVGGVGVVGVVIGAVFGMKALLEDSDSNADGHCRDGNLCDATGVQLRDDSRAAGNVSTIALIGGGVALGAGVVIFATAPKSGPNAAKVGVGPRGLELSGTW